MGGKKRYICVDGEYFSAENNIFNINNRAFKYGDAIFETIYVSKKKFLLFTEHLDRLFYTMEKLKMQHDKTFNKDYLIQKITRLLNANKLFIGARVRITVYRNSIGLYTPETNNISFAIEAEELLNSTYQLNRKGLRIDTYTEIKKATNYFSGLKTTNSLLFVMAGIYKKENSVDDVIIFNQDNLIVETISSNIFVVKNNVIFTPSLEHGCLNGIMRNTIIDIALKNNYSVADEAQLKINDIKNADEIFLTNAISGIKWVASYGDYRYYNKVSKRLINELNLAMGLV